MAFRFEKRFVSFCRSLEALKEARNRDPSDSFVLSGTSAKFNITFELAWKNMKDIVIERYNYTDFVSGSPREVLRTAAKMQLIDDDAWMEMLKLRNDLAHDYDLSVIETAFHVILDQYVPVFEKYRERVEKVMTE